MIALDFLFTEYIEFASPLQSEQTINTKVSFYNKHVKPLYGKKDINELGFREYQTLINNLLRQGLAPKTVKNIRDLLQVMYKMAIKLDYTKINPLTGVELPKFDNTRYFNFSEEQQKHIIKSLISYDIKPHCDIFFFLLQGRRKNEVLSITWQMIDMSNMVYYIPAQINKAKRHMEYKMTQELYDRLLYHHTMASMEQKTPYPQGYVFINPDTQTKYVDLKRAWKKFREFYGIPEMRLHDIRHLIGTYAINVLELPIEKVSHTLGHTSISTTQKYNTVAPTTSKEVIDKVLASVS